MKKHTALFMLSARRTLPRLALLLALTAAAETALFYPALRRALAAGSCYPETLFTSARIPLVCGAAFLALCALLTLPACELGGRQGYTLRRLALPRWEIFLWQAVHNTLCFLLFWGFQLGMALLLFGLYRSGAGAENVCSQSLFLTFYRSKFLHALLPLDEVSRTVRNCLLLPALGMATALLPLRLYTGGKNGLVLLAGLAFLVLAFFCAPLGSFTSDMFLSLAAVGAMAYALYSVLSSSQAALEVTDYER